MPALIRFLIALLLLPLLAAYGWAAWGALVPVTRQPEPLLPFAAGFVAYLAAWCILWRRRRPGVWASFRHELAHAIFCVLLLRKVHAIQAGARADAEGRVGLVQHEAAAGPADTLISLAPYFFPTVTVALLLLRPWLLPVCHPWMDAAVGASYCFHLVAFLRDTGLHQTDIQKNGLVFSAVFISLMNLVISVSTILLVYGGPDAAWRFLQTGPTLVLAKVQAWLPPLLSRLGG